MPKPIKEPEVKGPEIKDAGKIIVRVSGAATVTSTDPRVQIEKGE